MKQHKVIVKVMESVRVGYAAYNGEHIATYSRTYPSKSAAINNAREIAASGVFGRYITEDGIKTHKNYFNVHVEDAETGRRFNHCHNSGVSDDFDNLSEFDELNTGAALAMLKSRGFEQIA